MKIFLPDSVDVGEFVGKNSFRGNDEFDWKEI